MFADGEVMSTKSGRRFWNIKVPRFGYAVAVSAVALGAVASVTPASATTFNISGISGVPQISGTIDINTTTGTVTDASVTFNCSSCGGPFATVVDTFNIIHSQEGFNNSTSPEWFLLLYDTNAPNNGAYQLTLDFSTPLVTPSTSLGSLVNFAGGALEFWAILQFPAVNGINTSESPEDASLVANVGTTPLPAALPLLSTGLGVIGLLGWRRKRKNTPVLAA